MSAMDLAREQVAKLAGSDSRPMSVEEAAAAGVLVMRLTNPGLSQADAVNRLREHFQRLSAQHSAPRDAETTPTAAHGETPAADASPTAPPPGDDTDIFSQIFSTFSEEDRNNRLIEAAEHGAVEEVRALLRAGVDVGARSRHWRTALHWAAMRGGVEVVRCLIDGGAPVNDKDSMQQTPLHYAAYNGHTAVVRLLVASGADLEARNGLGVTPLHWTAYMGHTEAAAALLEAGANKEARGYDGRSPLDLARQQNKQQVLELLS